MKGGMARVLIVAGSDSGGGAGIQADIRTVTMLGGHAMTAIAAITAQNTLGVSAVHPVPAEMVLAQIDAVADDIGIDAVKIGMIGSAETAHAVADRLARIDAPIVFDPVMVATSGAVLADGETIAAFQRLMAMAAVATPNLPELQALAGGADAAALARRAGCAVLAKGGHVPGDAITDVLVWPDGTERRWTGARIDTAHSHGTGCTLASAIATGLGEGLPLADAVARARLFVRIALREAPGLGRGHGPMGHPLVRLDGVLDGPVLNQVTVAADDYDRSVAFYTALGLEQIVAAPPRYARFQTAGGGTFSLHRAEAGEVAGATTVYFECVDLDARVAALKAAGLAFDHDPVDQDWQWREARLRDPFGNSVCLYSAGEIRRFPPWRITP
ncbi:bifunctional hydroxymethylpyrimidine kinase/phosphomethylpyrimidine kinase [Sphingomonas sp. SCN 67-18]|uniref:bifunctional hydroxymethylpyrimidine kinase/phosphomethylpyrimidine kinase n=1 Tax=uncultured Sphingomonas sp. TaxID=158754 RepID=UPI0025F92208|nr:bifunctional hydroxymethylpyrimidine kinase/phosphomethylpyrimidine kinase [Sphingomonas sp. SCN 67-18]